MNNKKLEIVVKESLNYARSFPCVGKVADYIPELAKADKNDLGIAIVTCGGKCYAAGDSQKLFTMQSISKVISLILALQTVGFEKVFSKVGVEPTGDPFNSMVKLETKTHIPLNPMINAGAIAVASLIPEEVGFEGFLALTRKLCKRDTIQLNQAVYLSEKQSGMKNRSMAYFLLSEGVLGCDAEQAVDLYFKMCSVEVNTIDLAYLGCIFANDGIDIQTGEVLIEDWILRIVKTLMVTCGMYDGSGAFAIKVGMAAKSGVGGGILAQVNDHFGVATYGPVLDEKGNSVWGVKALEYLSNTLNLHYFSGGTVKPYEEG